MHSRCVYITFDTERKKQLRMANARRRNATTEWDIVQLNYRLSTPVGIILKYPKS